MPFRHMTKSQMLACGYSMGKADSQNTRVEVYRMSKTIEEVKELNKLAWQLRIRSKESQRINWHYARRNKETNAQLKKLLADMKIEYVYQQAGGVDE
jgi:hypothetical protein